MTAVCPVLDVFFRRCGLRFIPERDDDSVPFNVPSLHNEQIIPKEERILRMIYPEPMPFGA